MSTAAPVSAAPIRSNSSRRPPSYSNGDVPRRAPSNKSHAPPPSKDGRIAHIQERPLSSSQQGNLSNVQRHDFEQPNLARNPSNSRRSSSQVRDHANSSNARPSSLNGVHRSNSRQGSSRYNGEATSAEAPTTNGTSTERDGGEQSSQQVPRKRTTLEAQTGVWSLGKTIGAGSMGKVKIAKNVDTGEQVAVKIVPRQSTDEHRSREDRERADQSKEIRTAREAAIVSLVNHPYICGMRDVVRTNYHWYMLFEYVNGGQMLDYIISHGKLKEKQARKFGRQIASALDYCHRNSIVHRDLKIENILISKMGDIKIIDFGLSNLFSPRSNLKTFCGSLYFAAPELLQARAYTGPEVDIWSFGIVLFVLTCGKVPFDDQSMPQLHAKIKKGVVEYPPWISAECKSLISRMLVTDPKQRATLGEIMNHPWMTKGYNAPPENFLPHREPLQLPLDSRIIEKMTGFDFGPPNFIRSELTKVMDSEEYQQACRNNARKGPMATPDPEKKRGVFDFYKRRASASNSKDLLLSKSDEAVQVGNDPVNAFSPLISIYYLVKEKMQREANEVNPGALSMPRSPGEQPLKLPELPAPEAAYTNANAYEQAGETTGGRARPRARTHGEDEVTGVMQNVSIADPQPPRDVQAPGEQAPVKKEGMATGLLRRFSTRKNRDVSREGMNQPPKLEIQPPESSAFTTPRKSFSVRRSRNNEGPPPALFNPGNERVRDQLLTPPPGGIAENASRRLKALGRSASVNSADIRRRFSGRRGTSERPAGREPLVSDSAELGVRPGSRAGEAAGEATAGGDRARIAMGSRASSMGHNRQESIQPRRTRRGPVMVGGPSDVPEETDAELAEDSGDRHKNGSGSESMKPVFLKGLFSVSTTSSKPLPVVRIEIIRVLQQLGVEYKEIRGGFTCRHAPSIDLKKEELMPAPSSPAPAPASSRRKTSFGFGAGENKERGDFRKQEQQQPSGSTPATGLRTPAPRRGNNASSEPSYNPSEEDSDSVPDLRAPRRRRTNRDRVPGETSTHVESDTGENMALRFEIFVVKVPFLGLHGIQFKKVNGGTWAYKNMAQTILQELRL